MSFAKVPVPGPPHAASPVADLLPMSDSVLLIIAAVYILLIALYLSSKRRHTPGVQSASNLEVAGQLWIDRKTRILELSTGAGPVLLVLSENGVSLSTLGVQTQAEPDSRFIEVLRQKREEVA